MTRREALKLLQINQIYPDLVLVQEQYELLQKVYNPTNYQTDKHEIYERLLQQLTQAYSKIANEDTFKEFSDDSFISDDDLSDDNSELTYREVFIERGLVGVFGQYISRSVLGKVFRYIFRFSRYANEEEGYDDDTTQETTEGRGSKEKQQSHRKKSRKKHKQQHERKKGEKKKQSDRKKEYRKNHKKDKKR